MATRDSAKAYLEKLHTRQLLNLRDHAFAICKPTRTLPKDPSIDVTDCLSVRVSEIRYELSKREHIPNKAEAKKIRQEKAKTR
jgi:hypothetical protein